MSVIMTAAGEALKARLQAEGKPLVIDTFVFAHIPNLDPTEQLTPGITVPTEQVVYAYPIPDEYRAYVNPNQVVYSALLVRTWATGPSTGRGWSVPSTTP